VSVAPNAASARLNTEIYISDSYTHLRTRTSTGRRATAPSTCSICRLQSAGAVAVCGGHLCATAGKDAFRLQKQAHFQLYQHNLYACLRPTRQHLPRHSCLIAPNQAFKCCLTLLCMNIRRSRDSHGRVQVCSSIVQSLGQNPRPIGGLS
jgi:hypothetical protein